MIPSKPRRAHPRQASLAFATWLASMAACMPADDHPELADGRDDPFLLGGKADGIGQDVSDEEVAAILHLVNHADFEVLDDDVRLDVRAASNIVDARPIADLPQLDAVAWVGPRAFGKLLTYVRAHEPTAYACETVDVRVTARLLEHSAAASVKVFAYRGDEAIELGTSSNLTHFFRNYQVSVPLELAADPRVTLGVEEDNASVMYVALTVDGDDLADNHLVIDGPGGDHWDYRHVVDEDYSDWKLMLPATAACAERSPALLAEQSRELDVAAGDYAIVRFEPSEEDTADTAYLWTYIDEPGACTNAILSFIDDDLRHWRQVDTLDGAISAVRLPGGAGTLFVPGPCKVTLYTENLPS